MFLNYILRNDLGRFLVVLQGRLDSLSDNIACTSSCGVEGTNCDNAEH